MNVLDISLRSTLSRLIRHSSKETSNIFSLPKYATIAHAFQADDHVIMQSLLPYRQFNPLSLNPCPCAWLFHKFMIYKHRINVAFVSEKEQRNRGGEIVRRYSGSIRETCLTTLRGYPSGREDGAVLIGAPPSLDGPVQTLKGAETTQCILAGRVL
jgi:hypothetical protein